jgi:uncharacterized protein (DUF433 family)
VADVDSGIIVSMTDEKAEIAPGITVNRKAGFGQPVIKGTDVKIATILARLAAGSDLADLLRELSLTSASVQDALAYAAEIIGDEPPSRLNEAVELSPGVIKDGRIRFGKPIIQGTRIDVATILGHLGAGDSVEDLASEYSLTVEGIKAALGYAQKVVAREKVSAI